MRTIKNKSTSILLSLILVLSILLIPGTTKANTIAATTTTNKHHITDVIVYCTNSIYNPFTHQYDTYLTNEDGETYMIQTYDNNKGKWFAAIIDDKDNSNIKDDEVIKTYPLDDYIFNDLKE